MKKSQTLAVLAGARTPFSKILTDLANVSAVDLGCVALGEAVRRSGLASQDVDEVIFGNVSGPPDAANIARVIALKSGVPNDRVAHTVNRNCASGMESIIEAWFAIQHGRARVVVAGGTESMSQVPLLVRPEAAKLWMRLAKSKTMMQKLATLTRFRPRDFKPVVGIELGLTDPVSGLNMGQTAEVLAREFAITRDRQDAFAVDSHVRAAAAQARCFLSGEIVGVPRGDREPVTKDNGPRANQSMDQLAKLRPIFDRGGTVTAGNSCPLTDGAAALVLVDAANVDQFDTEPLGYITGYAIAGCDPRRMGLGPVYATAKLMKETGLRMSDFDAIEINEAFAAQVLACQAAAGSKSFAQNELGLDQALGEFPTDRLNLHGGAIALGHPVGTTGTRLILTLLRTLRERGGRRGLATLCVGGGQGFAMVVETSKES